MAENQMLVHFGHRVFEFFERHQIDRVYVSAGALDHLVDVSSDGSLGKFARVCRCSHQRCSRSLAVGLPDKLFDEGLALLAERILKFFSTDGFISPWLSPALRSGVADHHFASTFFGDGFSSTP
ncbi:hypothetical protein ACIBM3_22820 [Rhodococcus erythropolis]|uniref:hypothetical protein n=1 Tax=Rhodococcus erythropolis TaxID=1833 RepID=UPI0037BC0DAE